MVGLSVSRRILICALLTGAMVWKDVQLGSSSALITPSELSETSFVPSSVRPRINQRVPISEDVRRKAGLFTTHSYCRMTRWLWTKKNTPSTKKTDKECYDKLQKPFWGRLLHNSTEQLKKANQLRNRDTVFVPHSALETFVERILPDLTASIVVISGQTRQVPPANESAIQVLVRNPKIIRWFCQNLPIHGGSDPRHPKISPFPYGLVDIEWYMDKEYKWYKNIFLSSLSNSSITAKSESLIFAGPMSGTNKARENITKSSPMSNPKYYQRMGKSMYILSPDGDRPECYRHYEALGMGTKPITELDPFLFRHFGSNVVYNTSDWDLAALKMTLDPKPVVNRNLVREAYWMEWANSEAGVSLTWNNYSNGNGLSGEETGLLNMMDWPVHASI